MDEQVHAQDRELDHAGASQGAAQSPPPAGSHTLIREEQRVARTSSSTTLVSASARRRCLNSWSGHCGCPRPIGRDDDPASLAWLDPAHVPLLRRRVAESEVPRAVAMGTDVRSVRLNPHGGSHERHHCASALCCGLRDRRLVGGRAARALEPPRRVLLPRRVHVHRGLHDRLRTRCPARLGDPIKDVRPDQGVAGRGACAARRCALKATQMRGRSPRYTRAPCCR